MSTSRRGFIKGSVAAVAGLSISSVTGARTAYAAPQAAAEKPESFEISLAQWSLHRTLRKGMDNLDFAVAARRDYGIGAVEYVNSFFKDKATDAAYIAEMKKRADGEGVKSLLIMCDGEGRLGDPDDARRTTAVENHYRWIDAAKSLGCHSIRVNAASKGDWEEQKKLAADGLRRLAEHGAKHDIGVIVENHGGLSSNGDWLSQVMKAVDHPNCGTLPDFGNFRIGGGDWYDRYKGVTQLMPFAKAVSAKSNEFDENGNETKTDYFKMMQIVRDAGYGGYVGIEYEGGAVSEYTGIVLTKNLLERVRRSWQK